LISWARFILFLAFLLPAVAQDHSDRIFDQFTGRYHCGARWIEFQLKIIPVTGPLGMDEPGGGVNGSLSFHYHRSITSIEGASYNLGGTWDPKAGRFHLDPKLPWTAPHPAALEAIGIEGTFDVETRKFSGAKMLSGKCDAVELVPRGVTLPPLPAATTGLTPDPKRIEMRVGPTNVTNYLDVAANSPDFEYLVSAWFDPPDTLRDLEPIDESVAQMKKDKFACLGSQRVVWDAGGAKGTAPDKVNITERFVMECVGDCKGVFYRPYVGAQVTHFGLTAPLPTMQIKSVFLGGTAFKWNVSRTGKSQPPPEIYFHHWTPLAGYGPFDAAPAEVARRQAEAPPCKAPRAGNR
jgi:hypothetical protein